MTEAHKLGRELAKRAALNGKCTTYLDKKLNVKMSHNYIGGHIEKFKYSNGKVTIYDKDDKEIKGATPKVEIPKAKAKKDKASPKLPDTTDAQSSGDIQQ